MVTASIKDDLRSFRRTWVHHTGMQLATLTVLVATFTVVAFVYSLAINLNRVLVSWGESVQLTAYLVDDVNDGQIQALDQTLKSMREIANVVYTPSEKATENFKLQMAGYAPGLLADADFSNPFPASFRVTLKGGVRSDDDIKRMETIAVRIGKVSGVEDVSYGQSWVKNYSAFIAALAASGGVVALILLAGSLFVIGNSIRTSIAARREEIEILELVGATSRMIRRPYVSEGLMMGFIATAVAIVANFGLYQWQVAVMNSSLAFTRLALLFEFMSVPTMAGFLASGAMLGALGAWLTVRRINDGWSASQGLES